MNIYFMHFYTGNFLHRYYTGVFIHINIMYIYYTDVFIHINIMWINIYNNFFMHLQFFEKIVDKKFFFQFTIS